MEFFVGKGIVRNVHNVVEYCLKTEGFFHTVVLIHTVQEDCLLRVIKSGWSVLISVLCFALVPCDGT